MSQIREIEITAVLASWIALGMAVIAGGFIVIKRRKSVRLVRR